MPLTVGLRLRHARLDSGVQGGFVCGNHGPERANAIDERDRAVAESGLGAYRRLNQEAGNMNGCSLVSSRGIRKTWKASPLWGQRGSCWVSFEGDID